MCMICADEAVMAGAIALAAAPWYRSLWARIWKVGRARRWA